MYFQALIIVCLFVFVSTLRIEYRGIYTVIVESEVAIKEVFSLTYISHNEGTRTVSLSTPALFKLPIDVESVCVGSACRTFDEDSNPCYQVHGYRSFICGTTFDLSTISALILFAFICISVTALSSIITIVTAVTGLAKRLLRFNCRILSKIFCCGGKSRVKAILPTTAELNKYNDDTPVYHLTSDMLSTIDIGHPLSETYDNSGKYEPRDVSVLYEKPTLRKAAVSGETEVVHS